MDFARMGLQGAQPRFQRNRIMENGRDLCTFAVSDAVGYEAGKKDGATYRYAIDGFDHPDARLIAASPELLEALERLIERVSDLGANGFSQEVAKGKAAIAKAKGGQGE
jgi:hypothetical protein